MSAAALANPPTDDIVSLSESTVGKISTACGLIPPPVMASDVSSVGGTDREDDNVILKQDSNETSNNNHNSSSWKEASTTTTTMRGTGLDVNISVQTVKRFNFLVAGPSGSGKSTFCTRLLRRYFTDFELSPSVNGDEDDEDGPTMAIGERGRGVRVQGNTKIIVTIVDTPGFGDSLNNNDRFEPVEKYILDQNLQYETREGYRKKYVEEDDTRVHCCFYFLAPHRITPLDCEFLRRLQNKVAITPIVAKADALSIEELEKQLTKIHSFLQEHSINIFDYGETNIDLSWMTKNAENNDHPTIDPNAFQHIANKLYDSSIMEGNNNNNIFNHNNYNHEDAGDLSVASSSSKHQEHGIMMKALPQIPNVFAVISGERHYRWGTASEEDPNHSDTQRLHRLLFRDGSLGRLQQYSDQIHEAWRATLQQRERERRAAEKEKRRAALIKQQAEEKERLIRESKAKAERELKLAKNLAAEKERQLLEQKAKAALHFRVLVMICIVCLMLLFALGRNAFLSAEPMTFVITANSSTTVQEF